MNKPKLAALSVAALMAGISSASAGSPMSRGNTNAPAAKMQSDKTPSANATAQSGDALTLSEAQRKMAWQDLYMDSRDVPALKPYSFAMVQKKLVIVIAE